MSRNPFTEPQFGDVFRSSPGGPPGWDHAVLYLCPVTGSKDWWGLEIDIDGPTEPRAWVALTAAWVQWKYVAPELAFYGFRPDGSVGKVDL